MAKMKMSVSMDGLRRNLTRAYNELVEGIQEITEKGGGIYTDNTEYIEQLLEEVRWPIAVLNAVYIKDFEMFGDMTELVLDNYDPNGGQEGEGEDY